VTIAAVGLNVTELPAQVSLLSSALAAIGVPHQLESLKDGDSSMSPNAQPNVLYLIVEQKPPISPEETRTR
jgi:hypothetical protein